MFFLCLLAQLGGVFSEINWEGVITIIILRTIFFFRYKREQKHSNNSFLLLLFDGRKHFWLDVSDSLHEWSEFKWTKELSREDAFCQVSTELVWIYSWWYFFVNFHIDHLIYFRLQTTMASDTGQKNKLSIE